MTVLKQITVINCKCWLVMLVLHLFHLETACYGDEGSGLKKTKSGVRTCWYMYVNYVIGAEACTMQGRDQCEYVTTNWCTLIMRANMWIIE